MRRWPTIVENHVRTVEQRILAPLRDHVFVGLNDCNQAIAKLLVELNNRPFQKMPGSRKELFAELDAPAMLALRVEQYEYGQWTRGRVGFNYHIAFDGCFYSAPHTLHSKVLDTTEDPRSSLLRSLWKAGIR